MKAKGNGDLLVLEHSSEILQVLCTQNPHLFKDFKKDFQEVLGADDFFSCNVNTLRIWSKLIDKFLDETQTDVLTEYFDQLFKKSKFHVSLQKQKQRK